MEFETYQPGYSLPQHYYKDPGIYASEINRIFHKHWLYAGHVCQVPEVGDFFTVEFDNESIIIVRDKSGVINAHMNVCRHRGSRLCLANKGSTQLFTCPYHAWSYSLDGNLIAARNMPEDFRETDNHLHSISLEVIGGFIFINLSKSPLSLSSLKTDLEPILTTFGCNDLKLAHHKSYAIDSNWKLAVENYQECYHCTPAHREFAKIHAMAADPESFKRDKETFLANNADNARVAEFNCYYEYAVAGQEGYQYDRNPLRAGNLSGTLGGAAAAPLLGCLTEYDGGASELMIGPLMFFLLYDDHIVGYRFTPKSIASCVCDVFWFVDHQAQEGRDYQLDNLIWLWDVTTRADTTIIVNNQKGVNSKFYSPGRLSNMEKFQQDFLNWYMKSITIDHEK